MSILDKIKKATEAPLYLKMMVYGDPGTGKTHFAGTIPNCLILDMEGGVTTLQGMNSQADVLRIEKWTDLLEVFQFLKGEHSYKTVVLDHLTEAQRLLMRYVIEQAAPNRKRETKDLPSQQDWGHNLELILRLARAFRDLPMNVLLIAWKQEQKDEIDGSITVKPALKGKTTAEEIMGMMDIVGIMGRRGEDFVMRVKPTQKIQAKTRFNNFPEELVNPTWADIEKLLADWKKQHQPEKKKEVK